MISYNDFTEKEIKRIYDDELWLFKKMEDIPEDIIDICGVDIISDIDKKYQTQSMVERVVEESPWLLVHVRQDLLDRDNILKHIEEFPSLIVVLDKGLQTQSMVERVVDKEPWLLSYVREDLLTQDIVERCVERDPWLLRYVRKDLQTQSMVNKAVNEVPYMLQFVRPGSSDTGNGK